MLKKASTKTTQQIGINACRDHQLKIYKCSRARYEPSTKGRESFYTKKRGTRSRCVKPLDPKCARYEGRHRMFHRE